MTREPEIWLVVQFPGEHGWKTLGLADVLSDGRAAVVYTTREEAEVAAGKDEVEMAATRRSISKVEDQGDIDYDHGGNIHGL